MLEEIVLPREKTLWAENIIGQMQPSDLLSLLCKYIVTIKYKYSKTLH